MRTFADLPEQLLLLASQQEGLLSAVQCEAHGVGSSRRSRLVRSGRWTSPSRGVVDVLGSSPGSRSVEAIRGWCSPPGTTDLAARSTRARAAASRERSSADILHDHRRRRAAWIAMLAYGPSAVAVGPCALAMHGVEGLPSTIWPQAALPAGARRAHRPGVRLRQFDDGMTLVPIEDGRRRAASIGWALAQGVPELPHRHGLAVLDSALRLELVDRAGLTAAHDHARGRRGVAAKHVLWEHVDARAASPLESFGRWQCILAEVPPDTLQHPVVDRAGRLLGVGDMAWRLGRGRWLIAEMDGLAWHEASAGGIRRDRDRDNGFAAVPGISVLRFGIEHVVRGSVGTTVRSYLAEQAVGTAFTV